MYTSQEALFIALSLAVYSTKCGDMAKLKVTLSSTLYEAPPTSMETWNVPLLSEADTSGGNDTVAKFWLTSVATVQLVGQLMLGDSVSAKVKAGRAILLP